MGRAPEEAVMNMGWKFADPLDRARALRTNLDDLVQQRRAGRAEIIEVEAALKEVAQLAGREPGQSEGITLLIELHRSLEQAYAQVFGRASAS